MNTETEPTTLLPNPFKGSGLPDPTATARGRISRDVPRPLALLRHCPAAAATPLLAPDALAAELGVATVWLKDESRRMGLGSFKALGAAYAIAGLAAERTDGPQTPASAEAMRTALRGEVFACASAGNHGLSVAAGARIFGARAVIYLSDAVPEAFAQRLRNAGAQVVRAGADYEASMAAAARDAHAKGWFLLSDSSWPGYVDWPARVMEGYLVAAAEACEQLPTPPTHILLQAGVGGFAAAMTALFRECWGGEPQIVVVEPRAAPALRDSIQAGRPVTSSGPVSIMGRLDCKEPSHLALNELAREADHFMTLSDGACADTVAWLEEHGICTTPSGAAGLSAVHHAGAHRTSLGLDNASRLLAFLTEGPETS